MAQHAPLAIVILAAGMGTRMKSDRPKVMHALGGLPMINWLLRTAESLKPEKIVVVIGPDMKDLAAACAPHQTAIQKVRDGTGGALKAAMPALKGFEGDVLVLLGDAPLIAKKTLERLVAARHADETVGLSVLGVELDNPAGYGRLIASPNGVLHKIVEDKDATAKERQVRLVNTGAFCLDGAMLPNWLRQLGNKNAQNEYYITDLPEIAAHDGAVTAISLASDPAEVMGCNTRADLAVMEAVIQSRLRAKIMEQGVSLLDPASVTLCHDTALGPDSLVEPHVFFGPGVKLGAGAHIRAFSYLEGVKAGKGVQIGPFARLRPGSEIGADVRIGNFVEIKKSSIGARSKINHLSYVGDCDMGDDVNFSAGAITVNYDGFEKHKTVIGKGVMIGSNVNLVAPVVIDDGAFVAAGSTITEDVPADSLSIARDTAKIREGWAAEYRKRKAALAKKLAARKK